MSKLYGVILDNKIIGVNEDRKVCAKYANNLVSTDRDVHVIKLKKQMKKYINTEDLYLVMYGDNYIQSKYYEMCKENDEIIIDDYKRTRDTLLALLEFIDDKDEKHIIKTISILNREISNYRQSSIDYDTLQKMKDFKDEFLNIIR